MNSPFLVIQLPFNFLKSQVGNFPLSKPYGTARGADTEQDTTKNRLCGWK